MLEAVIVGGGLSGIAAARALRLAGVDDYVLIEKSDGLGGTWHHNTYPGCACDVPSALYCFTFKPYRWSRFFAPQAEIKQYLLEVAAEHDVQRHVRFGTELVGAAWDDAEQYWEVDTSGGRLVARHLILAVGFLHAATVPNIPGLAEFPGPTFHSSRWPEGYDGSGERVAVIGTGASAIQIVPQLQQRAAHLTVFQRTPGWVIPKIDIVHSERWRRWSTRFPALSILLQRSLWAVSEIVLQAIFRVRLARLLGAVARRNLEKSVADPELRAKLTPDYEFGCKRYLLSADWYSTLVQPNVTFVPSAVTKVEGRTLVAVDGSRHEVDTIVLSTGFDFGVGPVAHLVRGRDGLTLAETWKGSPRAYLGTHPSGFPNLSVIAGPNAGTVSGFIGAEAQANYLREMILAMRREGVTSIDALPEAEARFKAKADHLMAHSVHNAGGCVNFYLDENGCNKALWPGTMFGMWRRLQRFDLSDYRTRRGENLR
ncbi:MAG: NAD(P)/FAD-dependent oxidoreductase [Actinomycetota bacterium]